MREIWRSATGFYRILEAAGRFFPETAGRTYPVTLGLEELLSLRDALIRELPTPRRRPGPTEYKRDQPELPAPKRPLPPDGAV